MSRVMNPHPNPIIVQRFCRAHVGIEKGGSEMLRLSGAESATNPIGELLEVSIAGSSASTSVGGRTGASAGAGIDICKYFNSTNIGTKATPATTALQSRTRHRGFRRARRK